MRQALEAQLGITWSSQPLRDALANLSENQRIALWLDRRIDPNQAPDLSFERMSLRAILHQIAGRLQSGVGYVGPIVYVGPREVASKLWTLSALHRQEIQKFPAAVRTRWEPAQPVQWPELSTPQQLLLATANEVPCTLDGLESIPHDLWPARNLPPLTPAERLELILAGFDRTFEFVDGGRAIRIVPLPDQATLVREYTPRSDPSRVAAELAQRFPTAKIRRTATRLAISASAEDHDAISRLLRGETVKKAPSGPAETRYTMEAVNQPIGVVLRTLEVKAQLQIEVDENAREKLYQLVSFEVKEESLAELLRIALLDSGLGFELEEHTLRIRLAQP